MHAWMRGSSVRPIGRSCLIILSECIRWRLRLGWWLCWRSTVKISRFQRSRRWLLRIYCLEVLIMMNLSSLGEGYLNILKGIVKQRKCPTNIVRVIYGWWNLMAWTKGEVFKYLRTIRTLLTTYSPSLLELSGWYRSTLRDLCSTTDESLTYDYGLLQLLTDVCTFTSRATYARQAKTSP